ncbi:hypothetical protein ACHAWF_015258 [Thalassiosira exigua]
MTTPHRPSAFLDASVRCDGGGDDGGSTSDAASSPRGATSPPAERAGVDPADADAPDAGACCGASPLDEEGEDEGEGDDEGRGADRRRRVRSDPMADHPARRDGWDDLGLSIPPAADGGFDDAAAADRNASTLEDLLGTALAYDRRVRAAAAEAAAAAREAGGANEAAAGAEASAAAGGFDRRSAPPPRGRGEAQDPPPSSSSPSPSSPLSPELRSQVRSYVRRIASRYHRVGFHSFEHASHVLLSAAKVVYLLQSQSPPNDDARDRGEPDDEAGERDFDDRDKDDDDDDDDDDDESERRRGRPHRPRRRPRHRPRRRPVPILYGTIHDPWLHFAICLSALLHDVDHRGVPNAALRAERDPLAERYGDPSRLDSYAEWNSLDVGLSLLREERDEFGALADAVEGMGTEAEAEAEVGDGRGGGDGGGGGERPEGGRRRSERFYEMVTDLVLCTDIASKERRELGMKKWERAWERGGRGGERRRRRRRGRRESHRSSTSTVVTDNTSSDAASPGDDGEHRAADLLAPEAAAAISEQVMQAADVSHTMQDFATFVKWNGHLYREVVAAHDCGRTALHRAAAAAAAEGEAGTGDDNANADADANDAPGIPHPREKWYESQISFFDFYIVPLAERLDACGAFGPTTRFAPLARRNKERWIAEGREITRAIVEGAEGTALLPPVPAAAAAEEEEERSASPAACDGARQGEEEDAPDDEEDAVATISRVSFAASYSSRGSRLNPSALAKYQASSSSLGTGTETSYEIDVSVDAIVPNIMVRQLAETLKSDMSAPRALSAVSQSSSPPGRAGGLDAASLRASALGISVRRALPSPPTLREAIVRYRSRGSIRRRRGALLFVDISGFTNLSQNYPVEDFKTFINEYFTKIIELVVAFGGEVVKFAGDALYAIWSDGAEGGDNGSEGADGGKPDLSCPGGIGRHVVNVERCTACAIALNSSCNGYRVSKSYSTRRSSTADSSASSADGDGNGGVRGQGEVLYRFQDKGAEYEERGAVLNVYCGVGEGVMAGVDVVANGRAEFFLVGRPLKDVAKAEGLAHAGELVISPSVASVLRSMGPESIASKLVFDHKEDGFQRAEWPDHPSTDDMLHNLNASDAVEERASVQSLLSELVHTAELDDDDADPAVLQSELMRLLECHRHEATRGVVGKFAAELRNVVIIFISIQYEPELPDDDPSQDDSFLESFQSIYSIISESVASRSGQVRQFINDDKGTVFIGSFGLRGSVVLSPADIAVDAAIEAQKTLLEIMDIKCSIGITLGKIFCGETGSRSRYEYSLLGPSVNLSARLMAKGDWGQINCDEKLRSHAFGRHAFVINGSHRLKGYSESVPFYQPKLKEKDGDEGDDDVVTFFIHHRGEVLDLAYDIIQKREMRDSSGKPVVQPRMIIIRGDEDKGRDAFVTGLLQQPSLLNSSLVLEANKCFHDDPFYCFIPVVTRILLSFSEPRDRLVSLKKRYKRSSVLASFLANDTWKQEAFPPGTEIVPLELQPFLSLVNDFVFKGFPLLKSSAEAKRLKDNEKAERCVQVVGALIARFADLTERPGIISIPEADKVDEYSKKLLRRMLTSDGNLVIVGGADDSSLRMDEADAFPSLDSVEDSFLSSILGDKKNIDVEVRCIDLLDRQSTLDLFRWSLRREFTSEECEIMNCPAIRDSIFQFCGGMTHATARLAHTFSAQYLLAQTTNKSEGSKKECPAIDLLDFLRQFLKDTPTDLDQITAFRVDQLKPEEQMLLKIASVAGFDQYSFSQNLLETVILSLSRESLAIAEDGCGDDGLEGEELEVPLGVGGNSEGVPISVGVVSGENPYSYMFQGDYFERTLDSLVVHKFLDEVNVEMSDLSSMDSVMYRFRNDHEQTVVNGLMLNDQKKRTHLEVAVYYSSHYNRGGGGDGSGDNDSSSLSTDITSVPATNWELFQILALHYDLADVPIPAMQNYFDSSMSLASLGVRDKSHGRLISSYLMLEKILRYASTVDVKIDEYTEMRRQIAGQMIRTIGNEDLKDGTKVLSKEHLRIAFGNDILAFNKSLVMLTKFGQSVGTIEKEGYIFGSELYIQAILLVLLTLEDDAFANLTSSLSSFLGHVDMKHQKEQGKGQDAGSEDCSFTLSREDSCMDSFEIDDLTVSFPAFSGLLTFYRDSPIGANQVQETFLANLFVAVTQETNQRIHTLRTKCILSHLYLKHGDIVNALVECEGIKKIYDHDAHSLELVTVYGMDWSLICVMTMASTYLYRGQISAARRNVEFLKAQMMKLDEFASSTKAMSKGNLSSFYLLLNEFEEAAEIAAGINATQYGYFFKGIGILQEELADRELSLHKRKAFDSSARDFNLLSILTSGNVYTVNHSRGMLAQSAETLSDCGIEAVRAALCATEVRNLELRPERCADVVKDQVRYCQAGLAYLRQSLGQNDANNHERRKNYFMCLRQQAHLFCWHEKLLRLLQERYGVAKTIDLLEIEGKEPELAKESLDQCKKLSERYDYPFMQLLAGKSYIILGLDTPGGEELIGKALQRMEPSDRDAAEAVLSRIDNSNQDIGIEPPNNFTPPPCLRGVPSAA